MIILLFWVMLYWSIAVQSHELVKYRYINASLINRFNIWFIKYELLCTHEWVLITLIMASHLFRRDVELTLKPCVWYILGNFLVSYSLYPWNLFFLLIIRKNKAFGLKCAFIISSHSQICISWPLKNADINHKYFLKLS